MARLRANIQRRKIALLILLGFAALCRSQEATLQQDVTSTSGTTSSDGLTSSSDAAGSSLPTSNPPGDLEIGEEIPIEGESVKENPVSEVVADTTDPALSASAPNGTRTTEGTLQSIATSDEVLPDLPQEVAKDPKTSTKDSSEKGSEASAIDQQSQEAPLQVGPFIDLLGPQLLSLEMLDATHAQLVPHHTNKALNGKKVVGLYFSADWCGPCRKFTPELTAFYNKMNERRGKKDEFEIVWVSRCRDVNSFGQYFTQMGKWLALPPEEAMGERGRKLGDMYGVKGIPSLVLLDDLGKVITRDARNRIPADKAGIGFPWRNPIANIYVTLLPRSVRMMLSSQVLLLKDKMFQRVKRILGLQRRA